MLRCSESLQIHHLGTETLLQEGWRETGQELNVSWMVINERWRSRTPRRQSKYWKLLLFNFSQSPWISWPHRPLLFLPPFKTYTIATSFSNALLLLSWKPRLFGSVFVHKGSITEPWDPYFGLDLIVFTILWPQTQDHCSHSPRFQALVVSQHLTSNLKCHPNLYETWAMKIQCAASLGDSDVHPNPS